jgi:DNA processing protein
VLGTGIDVVYPARNADLYAHMEKDGLLVSEFAPGTGPGGKNFPVRNRLISGLSLGILVVEAAGRSGSLITARLALEQNREVFAVPGSAMSPMSEGCRDLIRKGAKAVFDADDILTELAPRLLPEARAALEQRAASEKKKSVPRPGEALPIRADKGSPPEETLPARGEKQSPPPDGSRERDRERAPAPDAVRPVADTAVPDQTGAGSADEERVLSAVGDVPRHIDEITRSLGMDAGSLSAVLTVLEMRGRVRRLPGMLYSLPEPLG